MLFVRTQGSPSARSFVRIARRFIFPCVAVSLCAAAQDGGNTDQASPPAATDQPAQVNPPAKLPDALRNPRSLRNEQGITQGPRMVAGAISITGEVPIEFYTRLEPIVGEFTFTGRQWVRQGSEPLDFTGSWTNRWILDGLYLESTFTLNDRSGKPYEVLGLTWYDQDERRYEAQFFNSASPSQTLRWGNFDDAVLSESPAKESFEGETGDADAAGADDDDADDLDSGNSTAPDFPTLTMMARSSFQPNDAEPSSKFELVIVSVNEFRYAGYNRGRDGAGEWRMSFEMTMTRVDPIALGD